VSRKRQRQEGPGALELIEEAVHLLRLAPATVLASYYLGSLPFVLGFLYFWADMSRSADAYDRCEPAALALGGLFLWMKTWQSVFARQLKQEITGRTAVRLTVGRFLRSGVIQTVLQPSKLFLLPLAVAILLPFGWLFAFYENVTAFGAEDGADVKSVLGKAMRQAQLWQRENHVGLLLIFPAFGLMVFLNVALGMAQVPHVLKTFLGIETAFTLAGKWSVLNTTFLATCCGVAFLCLDPLLKAIYILRCFYGESLQTGEDLKVELKRFLRSVRTATMAALLVLLPLCSGRAATLAESTPPGSAPRSGISPEELDRAIEQVVNGREYTWRQPREKPPEDDAKKGFLSTFVKGMLTTLRQWAVTVVKRSAEALEWLIEKIFGRSRSMPGRDGSGTGWMTSLQLLVWILLALVACAAAIFFWRVWKRRRQTTEALSETVAPIPDLTDENVVASQLPEDEWMKLARELLGRGESRLALRAFYLASLAHLAQREMICIAKFKSNRDYEHELRRRARAQPGLQTAFAENVTVFDRVWYGMHEVTADALRLFQTNFDKIKAC